MKNTLLRTGLLAGLLLFMSATIDLNDLFDYAGQSVPGYINQDNTTNNPITNAGATLGRVLFYDKNLSVNNTVACASCHQQAFAFSDGLVASQGVNGTTGRHSMRLVNARFAEETNFFWDERAATLEAQTTQPIQDHAEMGYSGQNGDPSFADLVDELEDLPYYEELFTLAYGDALITEGRMQQALAQFIRSIQSFDSRFDEGLNQVGNMNQNFPNYTASENRGKRVFFQPPNLGGAGCQVCHRAPEFDIAPNSRNNGVVGNINDPNTFDFNNTRSPSLRDVVNPAGELNGPLMHDGSLNSLAEVIEHYNDITIVPGNNNLDPRLGGGPGQNGQNLNLSDEQKEDLVAFLATLTGENIYTAEQWSDPFDADGQITIIPLTTAVDESFVQEDRLLVYPNPSRGDFKIEIPAGLHENTMLEIIDQQGRLIRTFEVFPGQSAFSAYDLPVGHYFVRLIQSTSVWTARVVVAR